MASAVILEHCRRLVSARYAVFKRYLDDVKAEFQRDGDESRVEKAFREPHLLVLDEVQVNGDTAWQANELT